jgi:hypothetical protein
MPKLIGMPDGSQVEFPDDMSDEQISSVIRAQPGMEAPPRVPMSGVSPEEDAAMYERKPKSTSEPSTGEYLTSPPAYVAHTAKQLGMGESGANRLGRDVNALMQSIPGLAVETSPFGIMGNQINAATKAAKPLAASKVARGEAKGLYNDIDALPDYDKADLATVPQKLRDFIIAEKKATKRSFPGVHGIIDDMEEDFATVGASPKTMEVWRSRIADKIKSEGVVADDLKDQLEYILQHELGGDKAAPARAKWRQKIQFHKLENAEKRARETADKTSSDYGGHLKTQIGNLLNADRRAQEAGRHTQFDEDMLEQMEKAVNTGTVEKWFRNIGKLSPNSAFAMWGNLLALGPSGGASAVLPVAGYASQKIGQRMTKSNYDALMKIVAESTDKKAVEAARKLLEKGAP